MNAGRRIAQLREEKGLSQLEFAHKVNINNSVMNRIEKGIRPIRDDELIAISKFFGVSIDYLLGNSPAPSPESGGYYTDPDVAQITEELRTDPDKRILFDATKDLSKDDINTVLKIIEGLKARGKE